MGLLTRLIIKITEYGIWQSSQCQLSTFLIPNILWEEPFGFHASPSANANANADWLAPNGASV